MSANLDRTLLMSAVGECRHKYFTQQNRDQILFKFALEMTYTVERNITRSKEFAGNQGKHQNFDLSILPYKFGLIFMGMKQKKIILTKKNPK